MRADTHHVEPGPAAPSLALMVDRYNYLIDHEDALWGREEFVQDYIKHGKRAALYWADRAFCRKVRDWW